MSTPSKTPHELIKNYKSALAHAKGEKHANETKVVYESGWFRVRHVDGTESTIRRRQLLFFTESLLEDDFDAEAYSRAIEDRQQEQQTKISRVNGPHRQTYAQKQMRGLLFNLMVITLCICVIWFCISDWQEGNRKKEAAQETKIKAEQDIRQKELDAERATPPAVNLLSQSYFPQPNSGFKTVLGNLWIGTKLYSKTGYRFYGVVTDSNGGRIEVALADSVSFEGISAHGYAVWLDRSYITENFVTK